MSCLAGVGTAESRTSGVEQVAYLLLGAVCRRQPQSIRKVRTATMTCDDTPNPQVHIDCSENAAMRVMTTACQSSAQVAREYAIRARPTDWPNAAEAAPSRRSARSRLPAPMLRWRGDEIGHRLHDGCLVRRRLRSR